MRVFITGASGFIGRALCERYAADGHEVRGFDLVADPDRDVVAGDVAEPGPWRYPVHNTFIPYPDTKIASEQVVLQAHLDGRVPCTVVRPGDVYGPRSRAWALLPAELMRRQARKVLGWEPRVGLHVGLERTIGWLREQGYGSR